MQSPERWLQRLTKIKTDKKMKKILTLLLCIVGTLLVGGIAGIATATSIDTWYTTLHKPSFNPPNYLFGPVWTVLYILMGISLYVILQSTESNLRKKAIRIFAFQLFLNFIWSFLFFKFHFLAIALIDIVLLWACILVMIRTFLKINRTAAYLQIPYLLWVSFASALNGAILFLNF
jgi:benzodiazapine receptor